MNYLLITAARLHHAGAARTFADAEIERMAEIYQANPGLYRLGVSFGEFIEQPDAYLPLVAPHALIPLDAGVRFYALLPRQRAVQYRLDSEAAGQLALDLNERKEAT